MNVLRLLSRTWRGVREHLYLSFVSVGVIATSLTIVGVVAMAVLNLRTVVGAWEADVHVSAYLKDGLDEAGRQAALAAVQARPEVVSARYVSSADAQAWLTQRTPDLAPVLTELGADALPASVEITLRPESASGAAITAFAGSLAEGGAFTEVDYGQEWVARMSSFISLLTALAGALGGIGAVATLFLVGNTTHLVIHSRRDELEIMRLVGATDSFILGPFVVEGLLQGLAGGTLAVAALWAVWRAVGAGAAQLLSAAVGGGGLSFLSAPWLLVMVLVGGALGALAAGLSARRFLGRLP